jgi:hypothetical protein
MTEDVSFARISVVLYVKLLVCESKLYIVERKQRKV